MFVSRKRYQDALSEEIYLAGRLSQSRQSYDSVFASYRSAMDEVYRLRQKVENAKPAMVVADPTPEIRRYEIRVGNAAHADGSSGCHVKVVRNSKVLWDRVLMGDPPPKLVDEAINAASEFINTASGYLNGVAVSIEVVA